MSRPGSMAVILWLCLLRVPAFAGNDMDHIDDIIGSTGGSGGDTHRVSPSHFGEEIEETERDYRRRLKADRAGWRRLFTGEECVTVKKLEKRCADHFSGERYRQCMEEARFIDRYAEKDYSCIDLQSLERLMR